MESLVVKRSIILRGHNTSVSVEEPFGRTLKDIAASRGATRSQLITDIDARRTAGTPFLAVPLFVLNRYYQTRALAQATRTRPADTTEDEAERSILAARDDIVRARVVGDDLPLKEVHIFNQGVRSVCPNTTTSSGRDQTKSSPSRRSVTSRFGRSRAEVSETSLASPVCDVCFGEGHDRDNRKRHYCQESAQLRFRAAVYGLP